ncbi:hypothetical protein HGM15179_020367, partial [Zosterops borbonicus]
NYLNLPWTEKPKRDTRIACLWPTRASASTFSSTRGTDKRLREPSYTHGKDFLNFAISLQR